MYKQTRRRRIGFLIEFDLQIHMYGGSTSSYLDKRDRFKTYSS